MSGKYTKRIRKKISTYEDLIIHEEVALARLAQN